MTTGTIKKVVADRGFGFIAAEDSKEYFFHRGGLDSSLDFDRLVGGERVEFEIEDEPQGPARHPGARRLSGPWIGRGGSPISRLWRTGSRSAPLALIGSPSPFFGAYWRRPIDWS